MPGSDSTREGDEAVRGTVPAGGVEPPVDAGATSDGDIAVVPPVMETIQHATQEGYLLPAVILAGASVCFTLVAGLAADTILTSWNFHNMTVLSFFQNWVLFLVGLAAEVCRRRPAAGSEAAAAAAGHPQQLPVPTKYRLMLGACLAANVFFTNIASSLLTYPVQVVLKSSKLLVTMVMRKAFFNSSNSRADYLCATLLTVGLAGFLVPHDYFDPNSNSGGMGMPEVGSRDFVLGLVAIAVALAGEAGMYIVEDNILFTRYHVSHTFIMKDGYLFAGVVTVIGIVTTGGLPQFIADVTSLDPMLLFLLSTFPMVLGIGVSFQLLLIKAHGSVVAAACQVFRKIASVAISMVVFHRVFGKPAIVGSVFVSLSLVVKVVHRAIGIPFLADPPATTKAASPKNASSSARGKGAADPAAVSKTRAETYMGDRHAGKSPTMRERHLHAHTANSSGSS